VPDAWGWTALGLLLVLLGVRAWVVESGHATLGRTPVKVRVLTGACVLAAALVVGTLLLDGGAYLLYLLLNPDEARALEDAAKAAEASTAPPTPAPPAAPGPPPPPR
jgi:threonine/homoserine/homoserine lactone efflux protein